MFLPSILSVPNEASSMPRKYKNPPVNEVVIGVYFNDSILAMRAEHVGLFWSSIASEFPEASQNVPIGGEISIRRRRDISNAPILVHVQ